MTKACFYHFFLHQTQSKCDGNVREKAWQTSFPQTQTDSVWTHFAQNWTEPLAKSWSSSRRCRFKSACFLSYVVEVSSAVIGSGAHMAMVAMVDNASGIGKAFMK